MHYNLSSQTIVVKYCLRGSLRHLLDLFDEYLSPFIRHEVFTAACERGEPVQTLERLLRWVSPIWQDAVNGGVRGGHIHVLRWMLELEDGRGPWENDFDGTIEVAATRGYLDIVQWLYERGINYHKIKGVENEKLGFIARIWQAKNHPTYPLELAAEHGHLEVVQWLCNIHSTSCALYSNALNKAVANGHLTIAQLLNRFTAKACSAKSAADAAENGHLEMLQWLHSTNLLVCTTDIVDRAASKGHLHIVKWLYETHTQCGSSRALRRAAGNGHLEVVEWIYDNVTKDIPMNDVWWKVANGGHLNVLKWIYIHFPGTFSIGTMDGAAAGGHLEVVMWLHEYPNTGFTYAAPYWAAHHGHLRVLQTLYTYNSEVFTTSLVNNSLKYNRYLSESIGNTAARNGHLEVVQWLHEHQCGGFTTVAMDNAAEYDHLNVVLYLMEHRTEGFSSDAMQRPKHIEVHCSFNRSTANLMTRTQLKMLQSISETRPSFIQGCLRCLAEIAVRTSNIKILDWMKQFGLEFCSDVPIRNAVCRGHVKLLQWFHRNGFEMDGRELLELAVEYGHLDTARWIWKHGYEITLDLVDIAGKRGCIRLFRWLLEYGPPLDLRIAKRLAMKWKNMEILWWVSETDRVQVVLNAVKNDDRHVLSWVLMRTRFKDETSRQIIRDEIQRTSNKTLLWIQENLAEYEECSWCVTTS